MLVECELFSSEGRSRRLRIVSKAGPFAKTSLQTYLIADEFCGRSPLDPKRVSATAWGLSKGTSGGSADRYIGMILDHGADDVLNQRG